MCFHQVGREGAHLLAPEQLANTIALLVKRLALSKNPTGGWDLSLSTDSAWGMECMSSTVASGCSANNASRLPMPFRNPRK